MSDIQIVLYRRGTPPSPLPVDDAQEERRPANFCWEGPFSGSDLSSFDCGSRRAVHPMETAALIILLPVGGSNACASFAPTAKTICHKFVTQRG
tara:strand:+ start:124 stop:405 length:282 start_codon:yes stop_codon:yes gene_type:complete